LGKEVSLPVWLLIVLVLGDDVIEYIAWLMF
jgi:hypothetical protein